MNTKPLIISFVPVVFLFVCIFPSYVKASGASLVLYFPFDEIKGDTVSDQSGNGFSGKIIGGVEFTKNGKYGGALSFDGATGLVRVEDDDRLDLEGDFTVMAWAYPTIVDGGFRWIADKSNTNNDLNYILGISSNNGWRFITRLLTNDLMDNTVVNKEKWYHVAGVQDGSKNQVYLYVNGGAVVTKPLAGNKIKNDAYLSIGCRKDAGAPCQFFGGVIDEFAIFSEALTEAEIKRAMSGITGLMAVNPKVSLTTTWGNLRTQR